MAVSPILTWLEVYPLPAAAFMRSPLQEQPCESIPVGEVCSTASQHISLLHASNRRQLRLVWEHHGVRTHGRKSLHTGCRPWR